MLDEITASIIGTVEPAVLEQEELKALKTPEHSLPFWRLFVQGRRHFWRSTTRDVRAAETLLEQALRLEPDDVSALAILAHCKLFDVWSGTAADPRGAVDEAYRIALKAVAADGSDAFAHFTLGVVLSLLDRMFEAKAEQRRALELNPYLAAALGEMGRLLAFEGESEAALAHCDRALAISPNDVQAWLWCRAKALANFSAGDYEAAARNAADARARKPDRFSLCYLLAACYSAAGQMDHARRTLAEGDQLAREQLGLEGPGYTLEALKTGHPFVRSQDSEKLVQALRECGWAGI
jgi:tetratricopeptide (TPR) repeat protein